MLDVYRSSFKEACEEIEASLVNLGIPMDLDVLE